MSEQIVYNGALMLRNMVQKDPGMIVGPLSSFFGYILNIVYDFIYALTGAEANTLGLSIILMTIIAKIIMLPLAAKSQKSMGAMQKLQPQVEKIKAKYSDSKDPEIQKKMNMEIQQLYSTNKANPLMGCLPLFIQFPIFMALYYIMNQSYRFVDKLGQLYYSIAALIMDGNNNELMKSFFVTKLPKGLSIDIAVADDVVKVLGKFVQSDWESFLANIDPSTAAQIMPLLETKQRIENFFGIVLTENTGFFWPSILIPIGCVVFTFFSSYLANRQSKSTDPNVKVQQNITLFMMPVMMGFITFGMPAGVGLYWVASNAIQIVQQYALMKVYNKPEPTADIVIEDKPDKAPKNKKGK